jgi:hypothetical protein
MRDDRFELFEGEDAPRLSRAERRVLKRLSAKVDKITQADRRYFERFPLRRYRIRFAGRAETGTNEILDDASTLLRPGEIAYAAVKNVESGKRMRFLFRAEAGLEDCSEQEARDVFELLALRTPQRGAHVAEIDATIRSINLGKETE